MSDSFKLSPPSSSFSHRLSFFSLRSQWFLSSTILVSESVVCGSNFIPASFFKRDWRTTMKLDECFYQIICLKISQRWNWNIASLSVPLLLHFWKYFNNLFKKFFEAFRKLKKTRISMSVFLHLNQYLKNDSTMSFI